MAFKQAKEVKNINMNTGRDDKKKMMHLLSSNKHGVKYAPLKWRKSTTSCMKLVINR
jgi:hypothetical protein